jgi:hypothetical protein
VKARLSPRIIDPPRGRDGEVTRELLEPLHARLEAQAALIGALKERLAAAETEIAELMAPPAETPSAPSDSPPARRSWWARLFGG